MHYWLWLWFWSFLNCDRLLSFVILNLTKAFLRFLLFHKVVANWLVFTNWALIMFYLRILCFLNIQTLLFLLRQGRLWSSLYLLAFQCSIFVVLICRCFNVWIVWLRHRRRLLFWRLYSNASQIEFRNFRLNHWNLTNKSLLWIFFGRDKVNYLRRLDNSTRLRRNVVWNVLFVVFKSLTFLLDHILCRWNVSG